VAHSLSEVGNLDEPANLPAAQTPCYLKVYTAGGDVLGHGLLISVAAVHCDLKQGWAKASSRATGGGGCPKIICTTGREDRECSHELDQHAGGTFLHHLSNPAAGDRTLNNRIQARVPFFIAAGARH
jgi:hypothetical protein